MGSDGASNMFGSKRGLGVLLQEIFHEMVVHKCLNHRHELGFRDGMKDNRNYDRMMTLLIGLHYFYKTHKQRKGLTRATKITIFPPKVTGTRWLPHVSRGIHSLTRNYPAYVAHLSTASHDNAKAGGLAKLLKDCHLMALILVMQVIT